MTSFLEAGFPVEDVSKLAKAGRNKPSAVYGAHKWWARRPPESFRALLLAAALPVQATSEQFWQLFHGEQVPLSRYRVADPFVGGGTSLVEAQRLGAAAYGVDVDPLAVLITEHELEPLDIAEFDSAATALLAHLEANLGAQYDPGRASSASPLHYFFLREVECSSCNLSGLLYKTPTLVRDTGRRGAVVRDHVVTAFCPACLSLHYLNQKRKTVVCCNKRWPLAKGTYISGKYTCGCGKSFSNEQLAAGVAKRILVAVEEVDPGTGRRALRSPHIAERRQQVVAEQLLAKESGLLRLPRTALSGELKAHKPGIYGFDSVDQLFSDRQLLFFGHAFKWLATQTLSRRIRSALALAISNALASNNLLCGYATDYGRLAPLFSVRDYSLPALAVELNPLHVSGGRGTLRATLRRVRASRSQQAAFGTRDALVRVADASTASWPQTGGLDIVLTDPPYYDYIAYSDLSFFFRTWLAAADVLPDVMMGQPLYTNTGSRQHFGRRLGLAFRQVANSLKPEGLVVFTYHATTVRGWESVTEAICASGLSVTAAFPLWADAKSPGHGHDGNVEHDIVLCCRKSTQAAWAHLTPDAWASLLPETKISKAERTAWEIACDAMNKYSIYQESQG
jgi:adenine-specific DNA methylase